MLVGYQAAGQINDIYGQDGAKEIFQGLQTKIVFRSNDPDTAKQGSLELGEQEIEEVNSSTQLGVSPLSDRNSLNRGIKTRPIVMPSELQRLPDLHAYIKICQFDPTLIHFKYKDYKVINQPTCCEIPEDTPPTPPTAPTPATPTPVTPPTATTAPPTPPTAATKPDLPNQPVGDDLLPIEPEDEDEELDSKQQPAERKPDWGGYDFDPEEEDPNDFLEF
jgi:type IV secretory pathway TraG/TraD family ATPase VirD4